MNLDIALTYLKITRSDAIDPERYKRAKKKALKLAHPDLPTGSQQKFLLTQQSIQIVDSYIEQVNNPTVYKNVRHDTTYRPYNPSPTVKTKATHGDKFQDIRFTPL